VIFPGPKVAVVDDDESMRESLPDLLREPRFEVHFWSPTTARRIVRLRRANV
jgi:FixJ family two-component response regulator